MLGNAELDVDLRQARESLRQMRGRIDSPDGRPHPDVPQAAQSMLSVHTRRPTPDAHPWVGQFRELHCSRLGIPTHEPGIGVRGNLAGHRANLCLCT